ncbi:heme biosynthesis protein HemY [Ferrovum sp. PN-J185]|uniref:heme biosynthesis protein HemY n=1 Tax=Ferrovum sp. PN-J185 TaxID=1356306 RepID=UPI000795B5F8|nr:heme biosynthesis protein HemY [Ferrovum sp. PN-J185]KXW55949.1 beta-barrel assembly-enhancing protease [Ferrovum sp. PN-J185]MCC6068663.1 heme biosynthesis protein HemY [Ferrovum sp. PN-J185]MDE1891934.1 heme biosynthesis protein HemY [Betaproteobacteria bacterium]MDE2056928.1 heme biosynthesis protein HemY [Betaproteobacteria bacterium]
MSGLLWFIALFVVATIVAIAVGFNTGYVLIVMAPWRIEISLAMFVIGIIIICLSLYTFSRLAYLSLSLPNRVQAYRQKRSKNRARSALYQGLTDYFEGNFKRAEKQVELALENGESPALSAIVAARSAHELHKFEKRDLYLARITELGPETRLLRLTTHADLLLDERRFNEALTLLKEAHRLSPKHIRAHQLLLKAQLATGAWRNAMETLDLLESLNAIDEVHALPIRRNAWQQQLRLAATYLDDLKAIWKSVPSSMRQDNLLAHSAAGYFIDLKAHDEALVIIEKNLEKSWDDALVALYGECQSQSNRAQIEKAENWLKNHPDNAILLLTLAKLCMRESLWGKAQSYLDASIFIDPSREAQALQQELIERVGPPKQTQPRNNNDIDPDFGVA